MITMTTRQGFGEPILISFSGLDGSGKTTQISALRESLSLLGLHSTVLTFWDDIVVASGCRQSFVHKVLGSEQGVGAPGSPVKRRDKNVRSAYLTVTRHLLYLADAIHLRIVLRRTRRNVDGVIVMLDADPELACARKPEYPVTFMFQSRRSYFRLARLLGCMTIIPPLAIEDAKRAVLASFLRVLANRQPESNLADSAPAA
jgi:hypothetical protein